VYRRIDACRAHTSKHTRAVTTIPSPPVSSACAPNTSNWRPMPANRGPLIRRLRPPASLDGRSAGLSPDLTPRPLARPHTTASHHALTPRYTHSSGTRWPQPAAPRVASPAPPQYPAKGGGRGGGAPAPRPPLSRKAAPATSPPLAPAPCRAHHPGSVIVIHTHGSPSPLPLPATALPRNHGPRAHAPHAQPPTSLGTAQHGSLRRRRRRRLHGPLDYAATAASATSAGTPLTSGASASEEGKTCRNLATLASQSARSAAAFLEPVAST